MANENRIEIIAVKYPNYMDISQKRQTRPIKYTTIASQAKAIINDILFTQSFNYALVKLPGEHDLVICEPTDKSKKEYSRRKVSYHPMMQEF